MPLRRSAITVKSAVQPISVGSKNSPTGAEKNRNSSGNSTTQATRKPSTAGTASTTIATKANWVTELTATSSPSSQTSAAAANAGSTQAAGCGTCCASAWRCRQISHSEIGGTRKAWAKVSERVQISTIAAPVSR